MDRGVRRGRRLGARRRPEVDRLETRVVLSGILVQGAGSGDAPEVRVFDSATGVETSRFLAYDEAFRGGVRVAVGDVDGDGRPDIVTAPGPGMAGLVKVFSGADGALVGRFLARPKSYRGGLTVATGDVEGGGLANIVVGADRGPARVGVFRGVQGRRVASFLAGTPGGRGVQVAVGDLDRDAHADIVTTPVAGRAVVKILDGATGRVLARHQPPTKGARGGNSVAVGDVDNDNRLDVIVGTGGVQGAAVRVYSGLGTTPSATYRVAGPEFARGVRVAAVDIGARRGGDGIAVAPAGRPGATTVLDAAPSRVRLLGLTTPDASPAVAYTLPVARGGGSLAASNTVGLSTPAVVAADAFSDADLLPYQRLARFRYNPSTGKPEFVPVAPNDPSLVGKHVVVLVHGWAADYSYWVDAEANASPPKDLTWWDTDPSQAGYSLAANLAANDQSDMTLGPASYWLLHGYDVNAIEVSETGMAQTIAARAAAIDPQAVVLAYTWIDDSGTSSITNPNVSEAATVLNGERLADGLRTVLGSQEAFGGEIQLIGHSHGSKVATVAAVSLATKAVPGTFDVRQLTTLDSPEDLSEVSNTLGATNFNWYYLQDLNIGRQGQGATFVDNYISYLSEPYSNITTPSGNTLSQVVDVNLDGSDFSIEDRHSYSAYWYTGSGQPGVRFGATVGQGWSPLLPGNQGQQKPPADLTSSYYTQGWAGSSYDPSLQYVLQPGTLASRVYKSYNLAFKTTPNTPSVAVSNPGSGAQVTLTQTSGVPQPSYSGSFSTEYGRLNGISFDYQFLDPSQGGTLTMTLDGDLVFVMDASVVRDRGGRGTITLNQSEFSIGGSHTMQFVLTPAAGSSSTQVRVSDLNFFYATS
ncbi:FG-GAP repeat domain-containing protein [Tundrisphaera sp. TA3]|uniref:FG-GAP repeat domain-containing protein n=1 Tax=Tundrisphaera sp. TA3 TaxID=3435775 RepID=UPI003EBC759D